jgi:hypothetical protein
LAVRKLRDITSCAHFVQAVDALTLYLSVATEYAPGKITMGNTHLASGRPRQ